MTDTRFKIDIYSGSSSLVFGVYLKCRTFCGTTYWRYLDRFETRDQAFEYYKLIKDLPEYLP